MSKRYRRLRWYQFSLHAVFCVMLVVCSYCAGHMHQLRTVERLKEELNTYKDVDQHLLQGTLDLAERAVDAEIEVKEWKTKYEELRAQENKLVAADRSGTTSSTDSTIP